MPDGTPPPTAAPAPELSREDINRLLENIDQLSDDEVVEIEKLVEELEKREHVQRCRDNLIEFCKHMQQDYKVGAHHRRLASLLEDIERREKDRICVSVPPRHGKSQLTSIYYTAWYLGRNPGHKVMLVSHTTDLAVDFGRKVRNLIADAAYQEIFPDTQLSKDSKSAGRWNTTEGGEFYATGVGAALAGRGAHLLVVDDPHSEQDVLAGNFTVFEKAYDWFAFGARTRLMPGGAVAVVHCMVGDTAVLMSDGTERPLRDIRPGDTIASYDNGRLVSKKVLNWANQGPDHVYTLRMDNGNLIRANTRHPFLVDRDGVQTWTKLRDLKTGDRLVSLKGASGSLDRTAPPEGARSAKTESSGTAKPQVGVQKRTSPRFVAPKGVKTRRARGLLPASAQRVYRGMPTIGRILTHRTEARVIGVNGSVKRAALKVVASLCPARAYAKNTITSKLTQSVKLRAPTTTLRSESITTCLLATALRTMSTCSCALSRMTTALFAANTPLRSPNPHLGATSIRLPSTIATAAAEFEHYYVTPAISSYPTRGPSTFSSGQFSTSEIIEILPSGEEDVFDIQVEDTENFIANGVVSHNTRWHQDDLIGRLTRDMVNNQEADQYEIFEFPAILEKESKDLLTGEVKIKEKALWPEFFDLDALKRTKASMPVYQWNSQFQQKPTAEEASIVKREWWRLWQKDDPPGCEYIIMTLDAAAEAHNRADFTALTTWGVFFNEEDNAHNIILLNAIKQRLEFPELKELALEEYQDWDPDVFIVEKKSSGTPLYQELRRMGIPVGEYTPVRGTQNNPNTKMARLNSVADIVRSGLVWVPDRRWADDLVEEVAGFPFMRHDDQCFVADTLISMADGNTKRIADVRVGDLVRTPAGPKPVIEAGFTGVREVYELQVGGTSLVGTGNHPIATTKGWKPLDTITVGDTIKMEPAIWRASCLGPLNPIQLWSQLSSTVENLTVTLNRPMHRFANTFGVGAVGESAFIGPFGSSITGLYPRGGTSTTKMETSTTTILRTLSVCPPTNMQPSTPKSEASTQAVPSSSNTWRGYGQKPPNGTAPRKVKNGTLRLPQNISKSEARRGKPTKNVESARRPTPSRATARSVVRSFYRRLAVLSSAAMRAHVGAPPARKGSAPVYNLSVADAKCFYANGVLSHNCDATIMALMRFRQGGFLRLPTDEYEDELPYRQKVEYY